VRVISVSVLGRPNGQERRNGARLDLLAGVAHQIRRRATWRDIDALLLPAGYFRLNIWFGPLSSHERFELIDETEVGDGCRLIAKKLSARSPGCLVIAGIDTNRPSHGFRGDQLVVAFDQHQCRAFARKIFPVDGDTNEWGRAPYLLFEDDFGDGGRFLQLPNGDQAMLSVCYDAFALAELAIGPTQKRGTLRFLGHPQTFWRWPHRDEASVLLGRYAARLKLERPTIHLVAIHGFDRPGGEVYWQRHGLATASAALGGSATIGAGHFAQRLPKAFDASPLASADVPAAHLRQHQHRRSHLLRPLDGFAYRRPGSRMSVLVRLFQTH